jgi:hypothetical protein
LAQGNKNIVLVMGKPNTGKTTSLRKLNQAEMVYLNTDLKEIPFNSNFMANVEIADAVDILQYVKEVEDNPDVKGAVLDTLTFLMSMYERQYVVPHAGSKAGQAAWGAYGNFYREFIHEIKAGSKDYAILAHEESKYNEDNLINESVVPVKGAVGKIGVEADFTTILSTKQMSVKKLEAHSNNLLHITDEEREDGMKYVFCTRITKDHMGEKMRSAMGLWKREELYIDNDMQQVFQRLKEYYGS